MTTPIAQAAGCYYLFDYLRKGYNNDPIEVKKLQVFLRDLQGYTNVQVTGVFDDATDAAVRLFQMKYASDILVPWGYGPNEPTGYVYILTKKKINEIYCGMAFPVTPQQQAEITAFRNFLLGLHNAGITYPVSAPTNVPEATSTPLENNVIGEATPSPTTTPGLLANILSAFGLSNSCPSGFCGWLNLLLLLIIIIISSLWYREYRNKKKLEEINKDLSLKQ